MMTSTQLRQGCMRTTLQNLLPSNVKQITSFSRFRQNIKSSMIDGYNSVINSKIVCVNIL